MIDFKISVIIPIYNVEAYLRRCLDSVIHQTYENLEIILIDDGSTDNSYAIAKDYCDKDSRCILVHQTNSGLSSARNIGLKYATGKFISFIDSDDWISVDMFSTLVKCYENTGADIISGKYILTDTDETEVKNTELKFKCITENKLRYYLENSFNAKSLEIPVCNKIYNRDLFESISFPEGQLYEDMFTSYQLIKKANMWCVCNQTIYFYFQGMRKTINLFKEAAGIFYEDRRIPVLESIINLVCAILLVNYFGIAGVFMAGVISSLLLFLYSYPKYVYTKLFKRKYIDFILEQLKLFIIMLVMLGVTYGLISLVNIGNPLLQFFVNGIIVLVVVNLIFWILFRNSEEYKYFKWLLSSFFKRTKKS